MSSTDLSGISGSQVRPSTRTEPIPAAVPGTNIEALVLTCIDYRFLQPVAAYLDERGLTGQYDQFILAGASLGAQTEVYPNWPDTWWQHVGLAIQLHQIARILVFDHRDCGAYRILLGDEAVRDRDSETAAHAQHLRSLRDQINEHHPELAVELRLVDLDRTIKIVD